MSLFTKLFDSKKSAPAVIQEAAAKAMPKLVLGLLHAAFTVISRIVVIAGETKETADGGYQNVSLDQQERSA